MLSLTNCTQETSTSLQQAVTTVSATRLAFTEPLLILPSVCNGSFPQSLCLLLAFHWVYMGENTWLDETHMHLSWHRRLVICMHSECESYFYHSRLQVEVAETAEAVSQSAHALTQLAILLPSHTALFGVAALHSAHREGALRSARQHSKAWLDASSPSPPEVQATYLVVHNTCLHVCRAECCVFNVCWLWVHALACCCTWCGQQGDQGLDACWILQQGFTGLL